MEERRITLPFVKPASLIINTISKPDFFNGSLANNFVAESLGSLFFGIGFALKHGEFGLLGKSRFFHNGTSMYTVQRIIFSTPYL
jgi:hypothetical protein